MQGSVNTVVLLGPTAVGKTWLGVQLARHFGWDIISADSRQVYKGLDLGSGKDINEYSEGGAPVPYHLIDITPLASEYNVFNFQQDFYKIFSDNQKQNKMSFIVGGTGMYIDSVVRDYELIPVPENPELHKQLMDTPLEELAKQLLSLKPDLHNKSDLVLKDRVVKALEIELFKKSPEGKAVLEEKNSRPKVKPFVMGTTINRNELHSNIEKRLFERIDQGMIEEVEKLHEEFSWERLEKLGLEYRYVSFFLEGKIQSKKEMADELYHAICQFAKRQETWFRGMERKGVEIHWLPDDNDKQVKLKAALGLLS
ncbi:MAG: tRNA (adenosine(37)-N6)-dimethylallyltransferase MiaA [Treponema sp.]|uniref:tRNA (adenosine(37)-N6)-dimethylallyltransferase MiaA n=1 Tax=Treponema sp. TaxID=166 RepID=UPI001D3AF762|nr:tRNA (adenosine(37)-N6)-dimethylallyltransferase MiaA [Treponema sp.]MBS7241138.1 tRNA (adenosine(37)-N6)-dimethylallyltransferase MiaA [Treponema sp.]